MSGPEPWRYDLLTNDLNGGFEEVDKLTLERDLCRTFLEYRHTTLKPFMTKGQSSRAGNTERLKALRSPAPPLCIR
jgi:hypothetical protein